MSQQIDPKTLLSANYILSSSIGKEELVKRLKKLSEFLANVEQDVENKEELNEELSQCAAALVQQAILKNKNKDVKLLAACCLADIIRIFAPDAPYDDSQLKEIFELFIEQLEGIAQKDNPSFNRYFYLLERLAVVKAFVLLVDLDEDLVCKLFKTFFSIISGDQSNVIRTHFLDIMTSCIEESDTISQSLLEVILSNLLSPTKGENPVAYRLSQNLVSRCANRLQPAIAQLVLDVKEMRSSENEMKDHIHELIYELNRISSGLLLKVFPIIEEELAIDDAETRARSVGLLARMFAAKGSTLAVNYHPLFSSFLERFHDKDTQIRLVMVEFAKHYLLNQSNVPHSHIEDIYAALKERARDFDEPVRRATVIVVCEVAAENPEAISNELLDVVAERLRDKKEPIRAEAMHRLCVLHRSLCKKWGDQSQWSEFNKKQFGWIPTKIVNCYYLPDPRDKYRVEKELDETFLPLDDSVSERAHKLFMLYLSFDEHARTALKALMSARKSFQQDFATYLELREEKSDELDAKIASLASRVPEQDGVKDGFKKLNKYNKSSVVIKALSILCNEDSSYDELRSAQNDIIKKGTADVTKVTCKLFSAIVVKETITEMIKMLGSRQEKSRVKLLLQLLTVKVFLHILTLKDVSSSFPSFFVKSFSRVAKLLEDNNEDIVLGALITLQNAGHLVTEVEKSLKTKLCTLCIEGTPAHAKYAVLAITKIYQDYDSVFSNLVKDLLSYLKLKDERLNAVLQSLAFIAEASPKIFEAHKAKIVSFLEQLLSHAGKKKDKSSKEQSEECKSKIFGIKILVHYLLGVKKPEQEIINYVFLLLLKILLKDGELAQESTPEVDRAHMRLAAGSSILKLMRRQIFHDVLAPSQFQLLASTIQDPSPKVRSTFARKLHDSLRTQQLPLSFISILVLCATDSDKDIVSAARQYLHINIKIRRDLFKQYSKSEPRAPTLQTQLAPEYVLPHLIHLLAHLKDFSDDEQYMLATAPVYLYFFLEHIFQDNNFPFLITLLDGIKHTKDAQDPENLNIYYIAEIALEIVKKKSDSKNWNQKNHPGASYLPLALFKLPDESESSSLRKRYLPVTYQLPDLKKNPIFQEPSKEKEKEKESSKMSPKKNKKRKKVPENEESSNLDEEDKPEYDEFEEDIADTKKKNKDTSPKKQKKDEEKPDKASKAKKGGKKKENNAMEVEEEPQVQSKKGKGKTGSKSETPAKATGSKKKSASDKENVSNTNQPEEEPEIPLKKKNKRKAK